MEAQTKEAQTKEPALALRDGVHLEEGVHLVEIDVLVDAVATHLPRALPHHSRVDPVVESCVRDEERQHEPGTLFIAILPTAR